MWPPIAASLHDPRAHPIAAPPPLAATRATPSARDCIDAPSPQEPGRRACLFSPVPLPCCRWAQDDKELRNSGSSWHVLRSRIAKTHPRGKPKRWPRWFTSEFIAYGHASAQLGGQCHAASSSEAGPRRAFELPRNAIIANRDLKSCHHGPYLQPLCSAGRWPVLLWYPQGTRREGAWASLR